MSNNTALTELITILKTTKDSCDRQSEIFRKSEMEMSANTSSAMGFAYQSIIDKATELLTKEKNDIIDANYRGQLYSIVEKQASVLESEQYFEKTFNQ